MSYSKRNFIDGGFEEIGFAAYTFDLSPEQYEGAKRRLNSMMAEWNGKGLRLGFPLPTNPDEDDLDEQTYVPDHANEAIITNLAVRLAPMVGKVLSPDTRVAAKNALNNLMARLAAPIEMQMPAGMPSGAGNKHTSAGTAFLDAPTESLLAGNDSIIEFE